jgi:hypothetical protein
MIRDEELSLTFLALEERKQLIYQRLADNRGSRINSSGKNQY